MTRRITRLLVAGLVGALAVAVAGRTLAASPDRTLTFVDERSGLTLTVQTDPAAKDAGHFTLRVTGVGVYVGSVGNGLHVLSPTSIVVKYTGPASLRPITDANGEIAGSVGEVGPVSVTLQAQLDPAHHTAEATLRDRDRSFHLVVAESGRGAFLRAVAAFESAIASDDTAALYAVMNSDIRSANTAAQFDRLWRSQEASLGRITSLVRVTVGDSRSDAGGTTSAVVTYTAALTSPSGTATTRTYDAYFVLQADGWKLWYTSAR